MENHMLKLVEDVIHHRIPALVTTFIALRYRHANFGFSL